MTKPAQLQENHNASSNGDAGSRDDHDPICMAAIALDTLWDVEAGPGPLSREDRVLWEALARKVAA